MTGAAAPTGAPDPTPAAPASAAPLRRAAVIGAGVIGAGWTATLLARGIPVVAYDPAAAAGDRLREAVVRHWPTMRLLGAPDQPDLALLETTDDLAAAVAGADFVQENGPEVLAVKQELVAALDAAAPAGALIASSSSGLTPSQIQSACRDHPERILVGHPFNPVHLIPLVEVVAGSRTSPDAVRRALEIYTWLGKRPIEVRQELPGHIANRLQAALWREAYSLVARGAATVADIDTAISSGPGLRWAVLGPFANQHLSGGPGGLAHCLEHLGPPMARWWDDLGSPELTPELVDAAVRGMAEELGTRQDGDLEAARDRLVIGLLTAKTREPELP